MPKAKQKPKAEEPDPRHWHACPSCGDDWMCIIKDCTIDDASLDDEAKCWTCANMDELE